MTLNNLMVRFQWCWSVGECRASLHWHLSRVHSDPEWKHLPRDGTYISKSISFQNCNWSMWNANCLEQNLNSVHHIHFLQRTPPHRQTLQDKVFDGIREKWDFHNNDFLPPFVFYVKKMPCSELTVQYCVATVILPGQLYKHKNWHLY